MQKVVIFSNIRTNLENSFAQQQQNKVVMVAAILLGLASEPDLWQEAGTNGILSGVNPQRTKISRNVTIFNL